MPTWILAFGGAAIVIGLWTYGYNIMRNLGNRITLHSPSRGFSMELGSAITIIMATQLGKYSRAFTCGLLQPSSHSWTHRANLAIPRASLRLMTFADC